MFNLNLTQKSNEIHLFWENSGNKCVIERNIAPKCFGWQEIACTTKSEYVDKPDFTTWPFYFYRIRKIA